MVKKLFRKKIKKKYKKRINPEDSYENNKSNIKKEEDEKSEIKNEENGDNICIICLAEYDNKYHILKKLKCKHTLCENCFNKWYKIKESCPICRKKLFTNPSDHPDFGNVVKDLYLHHDTYFSKYY